MDINPSGTLIASGSKDNTIRIWNNTVEGNSKIIKAHVAAVRSVKYSSDGSLLLSASDDKTIKIWTTIDNKFQYSIAAHSNWVR